MSKAHSNGRAWLECGVILARMCGLICSHLIELKHSFVRKRWQFALAYAKRVSSRDIYLHF